jgi:ATP-dependent Clp protease ATP-binding subunit ClpB
VQRYLQDPLAERLLGGEIPDGALVRIDEDIDALRIVVLGDSRSRPATLAA